MKINKKISSFLITTILFLSITGLVIARTSQFNDFTGEGHSSCHGNITESTSGYVSLSSSSGSSVDPSETFTITIQVLSFTEAQGNSIEVGFPSGSPGLGDNKDFSFDSTQQSASISGSGDSVTIDFQVTAPATEQTYTLHSDAIYRAGGSSSYFAHGDFIITVESQNTPPQFINILESSDPLELGQQETFQVDVVDSESSISEVFIELEGTNYSMVNTVGDTYNYNWTPNTVGIKNYIYYANDTNGSWNSTNGSINVIDTTNPTMANLIESADPLELGQTETIQINSTDLSGISQVLIEIENTNYTMVNIGGTIWEYDSWIPVTTGLKLYTLFTNDTEGNWNSLTDSITVQDTVQPSLTSLVESADPLELGQTETIQINVSDPSGISHVLIEIESANYSMNQIDTNTYQFNTWSPTSVGVKGYSIYANDTKGNWNSLSNSITVQDTTLPSLFNLVENTDPIELGQAEAIQINATDLSGISHVLIEIGGVNYTMTKISSATWEYNSWTPLSTGFKFYNIFANDTKGNWNTLSDSITVQDTSQPSLTNLVESGDPLELGQTETIQINATDLSGISHVLIEISGSNYTMTKISSTTWEFNSWTPTTAGLKYYTIYANDTEGNWNSVLNDITVEDTKAPKYSDLIESADPLPLGQNETISIKVYDSPGSGLKDVILEYNNINYTMIFMGFDTWSWSNWKPTSTGIFNYIVYMVDNSDNLNTTAGSIEVIISSGPTIQNISKSADPLELGQIETIQVDVNDTEGISDVFIEIGGQNYTMANIGGIIYEYAWTPNLIGMKLFTVYSNDSLNNWNQLSDNIYVQDTTPPNYENLIENSDPIELGNIVTISIDATDLSSINQVKIEFDGVNYSMSNLGGNTWVNDTWVPEAVDIYSYTIFIQDNSNNWNSTVGFIEVIDTISPELSNLYEEYDPIELGQSQTIQVNITDLASISLVLLEFEGVNYTMTKISSKTWEYNNLIPSSTGLKFYSIYANDSSNNGISLTTNFTVVDTSGPVLSNLFENVDPLELGQTETIQINVIDLSGISNVLIELDGVNYTMGFIGSNTWEYNTWTPDASGLKFYTIYANDSNGNWNSLNNNITILDSNGPGLSNLYENADPLELGQWGTIQVDVSDLSGISHVMIKLDGVNYTMNHLNGSTWEYNSWIPSTTGLKLYTIYANDTEGNWNLLIDSITVQDTIQPVLSNLIESADPLELGEIETILINATDISGINMVLIEIGNANYTMTNIGGVTWQYNGWIPNSIGTKSYTLYGKDSNNNWDFVSNNITVIDTSYPTLTNLVESADPLELGQVETIQIDATDLSGIGHVLIELGGLNYTMVYIGGTTWEYSNWNPTIIGLKSYVIHANDTSDNKVSLYRNITVTDTVGPTLFNIIKSAESIFLGQSISVQVDITDLSGINDVFIEFENSNYTMTNVIGDTWSIDNWTPSNTGILSYTIYARDSLGNWNLISDTIMVNMQGEDGNNGMADEDFESIVVFSTLGILGALAVVLVNSLRPKRFLK
ncbi:MAG: hypothetical protein KGD72_02655 [Candidatus Lokiarchaeota archaeon]|nr:hypothetical protein [Candidatus Lokiarchaeota archaeon]